MKRIYFLYSLLILSVLFNACGSDSTGPSEPEDWFPLAVNNTWHYGLDGYWIAASGDTVDWSGSFDRTVTALREHQGGFQVYELRTIMHLINTTPDTTVETRDTLYIYLRETDSEMQGYDDTISTDYELIAQFPVTLGDTWNVYSDSTLAREVTSTSATASVPAGTFSDCAIISETDSSWPDYSWNTYLKRGVGIVYEIMDHENYEYLEISLENYTLTN